MFSAFRPSLRRFCLANGVGAKLNWLTMDTAVIDSPAIFGGIFGVFKFVLAPRGGGVYPHFREEDPCEGLRLGEELVLIAR